jgi:acetoin utilization deacetylase AcuC-like enzyme
MLDELRCLEAPLADEDDLKRVHRPAYVDLIFDNAPSEGYTQLDPDTAMNPYSLSAARRAAGAGLSAVDELMAGRSENAFCAVRPCGHHATQVRSMGFCIFNNIAVAAAYALEKKGLDRVAIVDFDVHHGNGTEDIFAGDERVLMAGTFQYPLYPYSGVEPLGANMLNVPLSPGTRGARFREVVQEQLLPALDAHAPQLILVSAGFDAHREDPLANLEFEDDDFAWITRELVAVARRHARGRIVSSLEGGYALSALGRSAVEHIRVLAGLAA